MTLTNNVIWRITTGRRTKLDDLELIELTEKILENFKDMDPGDPVALLQMSSLNFTKLRKWMGLPNFLDSAQRIMDAMADVVEKSEPCEVGCKI